jgi:hypothetical protein
MKNYFLFFGAMIMAASVSCSKKTNQVATESLVGKWVLTKSCVCGACKDSSSFDNNQTLIFSSNGQVQLTGSVGDAEQHWVGSYSTSQQLGGKVLNITLDSGAPVNFLYIPRSVIYSESAPTLILNLSTPFANQCLYQNTYAAVPN